MKLCWTRLAASDLEDIADYIAQDNPVAAHQVLLKIQHSTLKLKDNPYLGREGRIHDTRELVIQQLPYVVPYRIIHQDIEILRVLHTARLWPEQL